jgi:hypothetical protein
MKPRKHMAPTERRAVAEWEAYLDKLAEDRDAGRPLSEAGAKLLADAKTFGLELQERIASFIERNPAFANYLRGLKDPETRGGFRMIGDRIDRLTHEEARPTLEVLKHANKKAGRKRGTEIDDAHILGAMKPLVGEGMSVREAARRFAGRADGRFSRESTVKRLTRKYHRREKNSTDY